MSRWPSTKANQVLSALLRIGWSVKRRSGSHCTLTRDGWPDVVFAFHDRDEIGPRMLARIAKQTGLQENDLQIVGLERGSRMGAAGRHRQSPARLYGKVSWALMAKAGGGASRRKKKTDEAAG